MTKSCGNCKHLTEHLKGGFSLGKTRCCGDPAGRKWNNSIASRDAEKCGAEKAWWKHK